MAPIPNKGVIFRPVLGTLLSFANRRGYLPKDHDELERVEKLTPDNGKIEIYTPEELIRLMKAADQDFLPSLLLGGFAGLRSSEIERLNWRVVNSARFSSFSLVVETVAEMQSQAPLSWRVRVTSSV